MKRFTNPVPQYLTIAGEIASYGKLYFLEAGSDDLNDTITIYGDLAGEAPIHNPVTLYDSGRIPAIYGDGQCRVKFIDSTGVHQWTRDYDFVDESGQYDDWSSQRSYNLDEISRYANGKYYRSLQNNNLGNNPTTALNYWSEIPLIEYFNSSRPGGYGDGDVVIFGGQFYLSLADGNEETPPHANWQNLSFGNSITGNFTVTGAVSAGGFSGYGHADKLVARKTSNQTVVNSISLVDCADLSLTLINSAVYHVKGFFICNYGATSSNGIRLSVTGGTVSGQLFTANSNTSSSNLAAVDNVNIPFTKLPNGSAGIDEIITYDAVVVGAGAAFKLQFAQNNADAIGTVIRQNSILTATRVA